MTSRFLPTSQPVLQYSSAFDDEVEVVPEDAVPEPRVSPEGVLECVLEEASEVQMDVALDPQPVKGNPDGNVDLDRPSTSMVHGPYYYFYQGGSLLLAGCVPLVFFCKDAPMRQLICTWLTEIRLLAD